MIYKSNISDRLNFILFLNLNPTFFFRVIYSRKIIKGIDFIVVLRSGFKIILAKDFLIHNLSIYRIFQFIESIWRLNSCSYLAKVDFRTDHFYTNLYQRADLKSSLVKYEHEFKHHVDYINWKIIRGKRFHTLFEV